MACMKLVSGSYVKIWKTKKGLVLRAVDLQAEMERGKLGGENPLKRIKGMMKKTTLHCHNSLNMFKSYQLHKQG